MAVPTPAVDAPLPLSPHAQPQLFESVCVVGCGPIGLKLLQVTPLTHPLTNPQALSRSATQPRG